jgi:hypothetical protein
MDVLRKGLLPLNSPGEIEIIRFSKSSGIILPAGADPKPSGKKVITFTTGGILSLKNLKILLDFYLVRPPFLIIFISVYNYTEKRELVNP